MPESVEKLLYCTKYDSTFEKTVPFMPIEIITVLPLQLKLNWQNNQLRSINVSISYQRKQQLNLSDLARELADRLEHYVCGKLISWPELPLDWNQVPCFSRQVLAYIHSELSWGQWLSYSHLAKLCNRPLSARAIGMVMSRNPWPLIVPCHRVLGKGKQLGGFSSGLEVKKLLLNFEGIL